VSNDHNPFGSGQGWVRKDCRPCASGQVRPGAERQSDFSETDMRGRPLAEWFVCWSDDGAFAGGVASLSAAHARAWTEYWPRKALRV